MLSYKTVGIICCAWLAGLATTYVWHIAPRPTTKQQEYISTPPRHVAIIMDGNRRWARAHGLPPWVGHEYGVPPLKDVIACCINHGIPHLSVYAFSQENFKRPQDEQDYLFHILSHRLREQELPELNEYGVRINVIGDTSLYPASVAHDIEYVQEQTRGNTRLTLHILFCYSGRHDLAQATRNISEDCKNGNLHTDEITPDVMSRYLLTADIPDPDLIIRTGGRHRISNFLIYQMAYSEIYFLPQYWPDVSQDDIYTILAEFSRTPRTFGG